MKSGRLVSTLWDSRWCAAVATISHARDARDEKFCMAKFVFGRLRVTNAGCNENFIAEPAEF